MAAALDVRSLPPGYMFVPKEREVVEFYLLPRARGQPDLFPVVDIIDDDAAASTQPWKLFNRHNRKDDDGPYFYVHGSDAKAGGRQDRFVEGGFNWRIQKRVPRVLDIGGEKIKWTKQTFSLHLGDSGSLGWVMHEYTITEPPCPVPVRICHIAFKEYGQKRKRIPDGYGEYESGPDSQPPRAAAAPPSDSCTRVRCIKIQRKLDKETEQVPGEMEKRNGIYRLGESDTQNAHVAFAMAGTLAPPLGSRSGTRRKFDKEAQHVGEKPERLDGEDCQGGSTPQCVAGNDSGMTMMAFDQDYSGAADASEQQVTPDAFITQMANGKANFEWKEQAPVLEQQVEDVLIPPPPMAGESGTTQHLYAYPPFRGVLDVGDTAAGMLSGFAWGD